MFIDSLLCQAEGSETASLSMTGSNESSKMASMDVTRQEAGSEMASLALTGQAEISGRDAAASGGAVAVTDAFRGAGELCAAQIHGSAVDGGKTSGTIELGTTGLEIAETRESGPPDLRPPDLETQGGASPATGA